MRRNLRQLSIGLAATALLAPLGLPGAASAKAVPGPVNAGNTYKWGPIKQRYEFENANLENYWHKSGPGQVRNQVGMLTLNTGTNGTLSATLARKGHAFGRWETRIRGRRYSSGHLPYRIDVALVPAGKRAQHCGASNIGITSYLPSQNGPATWTTRHRPNQQATFTKQMTFADDEWHTFGVEVKKHRIAWFVDAHVASVEHVRKPSRVPLTVKFTMVPVGSGQHDVSRMQMDWLRYWTLKRPDSKPVRGPAPTPSTYSGAC
jgi:hypothetical protein